MFSCVIYSVKNIHGCQNLSTQVSQRACCLHYCLNNIIRPQLGLHWNTALIFGLMARNNCNKDISR